MVFRIDLLISLTTCAIQGMQGRKVGLIMDGSRIKIEILNTIF